MKRLLLIATVGAMAILSSCAKDYTCVCTEDGYTKSFEYTGMKEDAAKSACADQEDTFNETGQNVACKLD